MASPLQQKLHEAIQKIIHEDEDPEWNMTGGLVTKWFFGAEVALPSGKVILFHSVSPDTPGWQILGILDELHTKERAQVAKMYMEDDDD